MKKTRAVGMLFLVLVLVLGAGVQAVGANQSIVRIYGNSRFETAVAVSQMGWDKAETVIIARGDEYVDALAGVPLAHAYKAPILLTRRDLLPKATKDEIKNLEAKKAIILGGENGVSESVVGQLQEEGLEVERISGANRFGTAGEIARRLSEHSDFDQAVLVYGHNFPDAMSVASYAAVAGQPILLVNKNTLPQATAELIEELNINELTVVGGEGVISEKVTEGLSTVRVAGANRFATSVSLLHHFEPQGERIFLATGMDFADAITGGVLAARYDSPLLLVQSGNIPAVVIDCLTGNNYSFAGIIGGTAAVSSVVENMALEIIFGIGETILPLEHVTRITSNYGLRMIGGTNQYHQGVDMVGSSKIVAPAAGTVVETGFSQSAGNYIVLRHNCGTYTLYFHCNDVLVTSGTVVQGQHIANVGSTGNSTGPHLHFEVRTAWGGNLWHPDYRYTDINPAEFVPALKNVLGWSM